MFHLFNSVYLQFDFNFDPAGKDFILASDIFGNKPMTTVQNNEVYESQPSFEDLIKKTFSGNKENLWKELINRPAKVILYVKPSKLYELQIEFLKSVFKYASCEDLYKIHISFIESTRLRSYYEMHNKDNRRKVILDTVHPMEYSAFKEVYDKTVISETLQRVDKSLLSFEYLLADYIYNRSTKYKSALLAKIEIMAWDNWLDELEQLKYEIIFGSLNLNHLDSNLNLDIGTIETQLANSDTLKWVIDRNFTHNKEYIKTTYDYQMFNPLWKQIYAIYSDNNETMDEFNELINNDQYESLLWKDIDRGFGCIYTGEIFKEKSNHVFATYCYNIARSSDTSILASYKLDDTNNQS
jgi:hypothetical protein